MPAYNTTESATLQGASTRSKTEHSLTEMIIVSHYLALDLMEYARTADVTPAYEARALAHHLRLWAILTEHGAPLAGEV